MNEEQVQFLSLLHLPGRFTVQQTGWYLGFPVREIPNLTRAKILQAVGRPGRQATKIYSYPRLRRLYNSDRWMEKASSYIFRETERRNRKAALKKRKRES
jgi:hypothetical protein